MAEVDPVREKKPKQGGDRVEERGSYKVELRGLDHWCKQGERQREGLIFLPTFLG